jgi:hypothetical protein
MPSSAAKGSNPQSTNFPIPPLCAANCWRRAPGPTLRHPHRRTRLQRFVERYGVLERETVEKIYAVENRDQTTLVARRPIERTGCPGRLCPQTFSLLASLREIVLQKRAWARRMMAQLGGLLCHCVTVPLSRRAPSDGGRGEVFLSLKTGPFDRRKQGHSGHFA